jgi:hypothetical protein
MAKLKNNNVLLAVGIAELGDPKEMVYCFTARLRPKDLEPTNLSRGLRDLGRALDTFALSADVNGGSEWARDVSLNGRGPFAMHGAGEFFGNIIIVPSEEALPEHIARQLRAGLNSAAALLRATGYYRVSIKYKPVEQLELDETVGKENPEDAEEDLPV